jgi:hypothetical protein
VLVLIVVFWRPLQRAFAAYVLVSSDAPSEAVLAEAVDQSRNPAELLQRLWVTEKLPHRQFVAGYLRTAASGNPRLLRRMETTVLRATSDPDVEVRQLAFFILQGLKHTQLHDLALNQLSDPDPACRLAGLQSLRPVMGSNDVAIGIRLLADPDPRVVVAAAQFLRQMIGEDFGLKSTLALPQFTCVGTNPPSPPNAAAIQNGLRAWRKWWAAHKMEFEAADALPSSSNSAVTLKSRDFVLQDLGGKSTSLAQLRGKSVLLVFWSPGAPASADDFPSLNELLRRDPELAVVGICAPTAPDCCAGHDHGQAGASEHAHHHHAQTTSSPSADLQVLAKAVSARLKPRFPILVDPNGSTAARFCANDLPTYIVIDGSGNIRRRFVGFRTESALWGIIQSAASNTKQE